MAVFASTDILNDKPNVTNITYTPTYEIPCVTGDGDVNVNRK
jgi:hypothetical protein